jgi:hypothetical protein
MVYGSRLISANQTPKGAYPWPPSGRCLVAPCRSGAPQRLHPASTYWMTSATEALLYGLVI